MSPGPGGGASHRPAPTEEKCFEKWGKGTVGPTYLILGPGLDEMLDTKLQCYMLPPSSLSLSLSLTYTHSRVLFQLVSGNPYELG